MNNIYKSRKVDALANIYRASYCWAKNDRKTGLSFIKKSFSFLDDNNKKLIDSILKGQDTKMIAEKLCDFYVRMRTF